MRQLDTGDYVRVTIYIFQLSNFTTMFITVNKTRDPFYSKFAGEEYSSWSQVSLALDRPFFWVEYEIKDGEASVGDVLFLSKIHQLVEIVSQQGPKLTIRRVQLVSPGYLNRTEEWRFEPLLEVWQVEGREGRGSPLVYCVPDDKRYIDSFNDISLEDAQMKRLLSFI